MLHIHNCKMSDVGSLEARTPSNRGDDILCSCQLAIEKGEEAPEMGDCGPVTGIAHKDCNWTMNFKVEGKQQSPLEVIVMKDGKELKIGKHVDLNLNGDNIDLSVINPRREKSGVYKVILKNAQGQCERDINVNIMDKPTPPESCTVTDVFYDNCIVHWTPPKDDGGTEIKKYIVEALDVSSGTEQWTQVAVTESTGDRKIKVEGLTHRHKYRFRVRAANKLGKSDPCEMLGDDILIKDPWGKTWSMNIKDLIIKHFSTQMNLLHQESPTLRTGAQIDVICLGNLQNQTEVLPSLIMKLNTWRKVWGCGSMVLQFQPIS